MLLWAEKRYLFCDDWSTASCLKFETRLALRRWLTVRSSTASERLFTIFWNDCRETDDPFAMSSSFFTFSAMIEPAVTEMPSGVLISCAIPATSEPREASVSDWIRCFWVFLSSESVRVSSSFACLRREVLFSMRLSSSRFAFSSFCSLSLILVMSCRRRDGT